jgi:hypothetical protein
VPTAKKRRARDRVEVWARDEGLLVCLWSVSVKRRAGWRVWCDWWRPWSACLSFFMIRVLIFF